MTDEPQAAQPNDRPTNVIQALARVMADLPGIDKGERSEQGYNYRGIESITRHAQHILARHCVVFVPRTVSRTTTHLTINGRPWTQDEAEVVYRVYGPGGVEDYIDVGPLWGLGRDNSDKGMNKAMTQAFKYALTQTLCVGDGKDDPDREAAHEADAAPEPVDPDRLARSHVGGRIRALSVAKRDEVRAWCGERAIPRVPAKWDDDQLQAVESFVDELERRPEPEPAPEARQEAQEAPAEAGTGEDSGEAVSGAPAPAQTEQGDDEDHRAAELAQEANRQAWSVHLSDVRQHLRSLGLDDQGEPDVVRRRLESELLRRTLLAEARASGSLMEALSQVVPSEAPSE